MVYVVGGVWGGGGGGGGGAPVGPGQIENHGLWNLQNCSSRGKNLLIDLSVNKHFPEELLFCS